MRIPKTLKIGGHIYKVDMTKDLEDSLGICDFDTATIKISKNIPKSLKESTLIHEALHAINATMDDSPTGHMLLDSFAEQIYQVLKDNNLLR